MNPSFGGLFLFGIACHVVHVPHPNAVQRRSFAAVNGVAALALGTRGRSFEVTGVFTGESLEAVIAAEGLLLLYADNIARTFIDTQDRAWPNVVFNGDYHPSPDGPRPTDFGWCLPYKCTLEGLI